MLCVSRHNKTQMWVIDMLPYNSNNHHRFTAIIQVNMHQPAPPVKNWRILLVRSFTAHMPLLTATSAFGFGKRHWNFLQQCYPHFLHTFAIAVVVAKIHACTHARTHTHAHPFNGSFPGLPRWASTRKVKPNWILLKQDTVSGSGISWGIRKSAPRSRQITMPAPHHSVFYRPDALPVAQPTASKHWRHCSCQKTQEKQKQHCGVSIELLSLRNSVIKV